MTQIGYVLRVARMLLAACLVFGFVLTAHAESDPTDRIQQFIYTRECTVRLYSEAGSCAVIPFTYPTRPTVVFNICGIDYPLLFDTGTQCCLLQQRAGDPLPGHLRYSSATEAIAGLEAKRAFSIHGDALLRYALADGISCGEKLCLRDVPLRVYPASINEERDYSGAFAAILLAESFIEVNNSACEIKLYNRQSWQPPAGCLMVPLLLLPRGYFVPMYLSEELYWFHLDTGFSGNIGLTSKLWESQQSSIRTAGTSMVFSGWHDEIEMERGRLESPITIKPYPAAPWSSATVLSVENAEVFNLGDSYQELEGAGYPIGGIVGSGLLAEYNYVLDLRLQRLYIINQAAD